MKHLKMLGLAVMAAAALMAFGAGTASADTLCSVNTSPCPAGSGYGVGTKITSNLVAGTKAVLKAGFATVECSKSTVNGEVTSASGTGAVSGNITTLDFTECNCEVKTLKAGKLSVTAAGSGNGTLVSTGSEVTVNCFGSDCIYGEGTIGTATGGNPAKIDANASLKKLGGGFLCADPASWTASYEVTAPKPLFTTAGA